MLQVMIEMPKGTKYKYELDKKSKLLLLDRVVKAPVPANYGFILGTLAEDNDPLDIFVMSTEPIPPLTLLNVDVVGIIKCKDDDEQDDKILAYIKNDLSCKTLINVVEFQNEVQKYLTTYKTGLVIETIDDEDHARAKIKETQKAYKKIKDTLLISEII